MPSRSSVSPGRPEVRFRSASRRDTAKQARERLVALAASELVAQAERERENDGSRTKLPPALERSRSDAQLRGEGQAAVAPTPKRRPRIELSVAGNAALDGTPRAALWGGTLGSSWGLTETWSVLLDTRFERGEQGLRWADVRWTLLSGFAGAGVSSVVGPLRLSAGLGVRAGCWRGPAAACRTKGSASPRRGLGRGYRCGWRWTSAVSYPFFGGRGWLPAGRPVA